jgi:hypothetical protein
MCFVKSYEIVGTLYMFGNILQFIIILHIIFRKGQFCPFKTVGILYNYNQHQ